MPMLYLPKRLRFVVREQNGTLVLRRGRGASAPRWLALVTMAAALVSFGVALVVAATEDEPMAALVSLPALVLLASSLPQSLRAVLATEIIAIGAGRLRHEMRLPGLSRIREFDLDYVRNFTVPESVKAAVNILRHERVAFDYGARSYYIGGGLTDPEAHEMVRLLRTHAPQTSRTGIGDPRGLADTTTLLGEMTLGLVLHQARGRPTSANLSLQALLREEP